MKNRKIAILLIMIIFSCDRGKNAKIKDIEVIGDYSFYKNIDTTNSFVLDKYIIDLDFDNKADTVVIENLEDMKGDPQLFTILRIKLSNNKEYIYKNIGGYIIDKHAKLKLPNRIESDYIYIPKFNKSKSYLYIWDYQYPDCSALLGIYKVDKNGVDRIFEETFYINELDDLDKNGTIDIAGKKLCEADYIYDDSLNGNISAYNPFNVYQINSRVEVDTSQSRKYNTDNYVFEGFNPTNKIKVLIPDNKGKPYLYEK